MFSSPDGDLGFRGLNNTQTNDEFAMRLSSELFTTAWPKWLFQILLIITGITGNSLIIGNFVQRRKMSVANFYILFLAFVDLFSCCIVIPLHITQTANYFSFYDQTACKLVEWMKQASLAASAIVLQATAIDRYQAVCKPFVWRRIGAVRKLFTLSVCVLLGITLTLPVFFIVGIQRYVVNVSAVRAFGFSANLYENVSFNQSYIYTCTLLYANQGSWKSQSVTFISLVIFIFLVTVTMVSYTSVYRIMKRKLNVGGKMSWTTSNNSVQPAEEDRHTEPVLDVSSNNASSTNVARTTDGASTKQQPSSRDTSNGRRETSIRTTQYRATKALVVVTALFIISWIPFWISAIIASFNQSASTYYSISNQIWKQFFVELNLVNNALNVIVYYVYNRSFRQYSKDVLRQCKCKLKINAKL
ncbi:5-hydroxytryptamine receptor 2B-like [Liolophura sinensis]|uniref:5-hydroxytryptamine receptor 2B-like n=1 Tax=Liolophura sinensis TaxID=3198878 RepID=UPI0031584796